MAAAASDIAKPSSATTRAGSWTARDASPCTIEELGRNVTSRLESQKQIEAVLTPEQRKQFQQFRPWWMRGEDGE